MAQSREGTGAHRHRGTKGTVVLTHKCVVAGVLKVYESSRYYM